MAITPGPGYKVNSAGNGVVPVDSADTSSSGGSSSGVPTQTDAQRSAALSAAGMGGSPETGYYSRMTAPPPDTSTPPSTDYGSLYDNSRQAEIARQQDSLSRIEDVYNTKLNTQVSAAQKAGEADKAREDTISAVTGFMGSPTATTREGEADARTKKNVSDVQDQVASEKSSAIQSIYDRIDQNAQNAAKIQLDTNKQTQAEQKTKVASDALNNVLSFASHGSWDAFQKSFQSDPTLQQEVSRTGKSLPELYALYNDSQPAKPQTQYSWQGGNLVAISTDAQGGTNVHTFKADDLGIPKGTDFQTMTLGDKVYWIDKNDPFNTDGSPKMKLMGSNPAAKDGGFSLSPGERRYDANGKLIASSPEKTPAPSSTNSTQISSTDRQSLVSAGFNDADINSIQKDVSEHGLDAVLAGVSSDAQKQAIQKVYGGSGAGPTKLTRTSLSSLFNVPDDQNGKGFFGGGQTNSQKLDALESFVKQYAAVGYTDKEIIKAIQDTQK